MGTARALNMVVFDMEMKSRQSGRFWGCDIVRGRGSGCAPSSKLREERISSHVHSIVQGLNRVSLTEATLLIGELSE